MCAVPEGPFTFLHIQHLHDYALDFQEFVYLTYHRQYTLPCEHGHLILLLPLLDSRLYRLV